MKIAMIGQKGVPATHGGVERHVEELGARIVERGHEVTVFTRANYSDPTLHHHRGMSLRSLPTLGTKHLDAIAHSAAASFATWRGGFDIVHYHAIGPSLTSPIARVRGRGVIATIHGQDWRRLKWGRGASEVLKLGEWMALHVPHATISVSRSLADVYARQGLKVEYIPNGVSLAAGDDPRLLQELGIADGRYILFVGRLVPEKGAHHLIAAHAQDTSGMPLVIAGSSSMSQEYVDALRAAAGPNVLFVGYRYGVELATLFRHAALFVLPSDLEGLPIVLLEALGYGSPVLASDIPPNVEVLGDLGTYFSAGNVADLAEHLHLALSDDVSRVRATEVRERVLAEYDWERIADQTVALYEKVAHR